MVILFSPSETKSLDKKCKHIDKTSFIFPEMHNIRKKALNIYQDFIKKASDTELKKLFGIKNEKLLNELKTIDIFNDKTQKAVLRYSGVGYKYLNYSSMDKNSQDFIDDNMLIFSNLFGVVLAKDCIPYYKLKQGETIGDFSFEKYYQKELSNTLDNFLNDKVIVDLRASFYNKVYTPKKEYITFKFLKNGKNLSHWAKAYRGLVARQIAQHNIKNENDLMQTEFKNLKIIEIKIIGNKKEFVCEITSEH